MSDMTALVRDKIEANIYPDLRRLVYEPLGVFTGDFSIMEVNTQYEYAYRAGINWELRGYCRKEDLGYIKKRATTMFIEDMYHDFRKFLYNLERAVYEGDKQKINEGFAKLFDLVR